ncbi:hypothetical protein [Tuwongella immobilis]|uniref:Marine sediment metagenome DNA, contig: S01H1_S32253 n=1 Tax=Tuwongella immobilis TaxID=692036 RepID=A0A6C2YTJ5_9BACT|nr:hypothetical protein [Tuwongella immobilis]VIP04734.1 Marine sediment metagenome DNA, contig: S01H1_S32253 OS=marine sediment metagenome GN=S01H1_70699 PE=4 SV=1 [Tuwongella immobilis]VTS06827.1 Marine sediment metagenome DNA, contig: S01H1_S32253 OS=marine sediment metagenome GN=S01H1_70699 PE=4 SV=1 [Tuwongella immobilis]
MAIDLFERWFGHSIDKLRDLPNGDGAFAALMIAIPLYERYIIAKLKLEGTATGEAEVQEAVGKDLGLEDWQRRIFWQMFRVGFMHQAMVMDGKTKWMVSHVFGDVPEFKSIAGVNYICFDPWKFTDRVLSKYRADHRLITASESFPLASIFAFPAGTIPGV